MAVRGTFSHTESSTYPATHNNADQRIDLHVCWSSGESLHRELRSETQVGSYQPGQIAEYLLYRAALPVLGRKYRSFNYARAR
jgi:hypothetical protein